MMVMAGLFSIFCFPNELKFDVDEEVPCFFNAERSRGVLEAGRKGEWPKSPTANFI